MLTVNEVAKRYGVSRMVVDTWIEKGELRAINVALNPAGRKRYRVDSQALAEFEKQRSQGGSAPLLRPNGEFEQFV